MIFTIDITSKQTGDQGVWAVGICQGSFEGLRVPNGDCHLCSGGSAGMVPVCLGVSDEVAIQPGV